MAFLGGITIMDWATLIFTVLAASFAGAAVLFQYLDRRTKISIEQDVGLLSIAESAGAGGLLFFITNDGGKPAKIENVWIRFKGDRLEDLPGRTPVTFVNMEIDQGPSVPGWLNPGESIHFYADLSHVERLLWDHGQREQGTVYLSVVDGLSHEHKQEIVIPIRDFAAEDMNQDGEEAET